MRSIVILAAFSFLSTNAAAQTCNITLKDANVWNGSGYSKSTLAIRDGLFVTASADTQSIDASSLFLTPPFADAHTHTIDAGEPGNALHKRALSQGVFYALNPNNIRPPGPTPKAQAGLVELQAAGGGLTRPGGHPQPLYEFLAGRGWLGPLKVADLPGKAFYPVTTVEEVRAAIRAVKENGAEVVKLYLLDHDKVDSNGLSGANFDAAVVEAKRIGLRPIVHVESAADYRRAIAAKVFAIVHLPYSLGKNRKAEDLLLTKADAETTAKAGIVIVPTATVALMNSDGEKLRAIRDTQRRNLSLLRAAGATIAAGADNFSLGMHDEVTSLRSLEIFDAAEIINIATTNGARLAFPGRKLGKIETGYEASFVGYFFPLPGNWASEREPVIGMRAGEVLIDNANLLAKACAPPVASK